MTPANLPQKLSVLFDHDGSADDFLSLLLLLTMDAVDLQGICITPADCYAEQAVETTWKLLQLTQRPAIPVSVGDCHGVNAFPAAWRAKPRILNALPALLNLDPAPTPLDARPSAVFLRDALAQATQPVTLLLTGPCTNLVQALDLDPSIAGNIARVVWMGGAVDVEGNVRTYNHDGSAEWNVFWDPAAAARLLAYQLPLTLIPLDVTNTVPVSKAFLQSLARHMAHPWANLAGQFWATTVDTIPAYEYTYFMWDVLATSYLAIPEAFRLERVELRVVASGPSAGRTQRQPGCEQWVQVATQVDQAAFYAYVLQQFTQSAPAASSLEASAGGV
ncbi:nucleoside hydrolase [Hymenobacter crusticola]|uniref:Nucleoside hydrolase n=1 Tax=Hymenobacter crusticola TaxID=1770526 RepID=A0A243W5D0_9BACT|nr:nucleoside hydrolase [Hymenobacter crusticola]OUJ68394.1 nucleoside hydrolase [Hymenobacter crusticola]